MKFTIWEIFWYTLYIISMWETWKPPEYIYVQPNHPLSIIDQIPAELVAKCQSYRVNDQDESQETAHL